MKYGMKSAAKKTAKKAMKSMSSPASKMMRGAGLTERKRKSARGAYGGGYR